MKLVNEFDPIRNWAQAKGILQRGDIKTQLVKLTSEQGELADAILADNRAEISDAIGDMVVVLTSVAHFAGLTIEGCINGAYNVIKDRTGEMKNGSFVKNE